LLVLLTARFAQRPSASTAVSAALCGAVAAQLRYETILLAGMATLLFLGWALLVRSDRLRHPLLSALPLLLVPATWRMALPIDWEMPGPWFVPWSIRNVPDNLERLGVWLVSPQGLETGNPLIGLLALLGLVSLAWRGFRAPLSFRPAADQLLVTLALVLLVAVFMLSWWGQATLLITVRYFIPVALAAAILAVHFLHRSTGSLPGGLPRTLPIIISSLLFCLQLPVLREARPYATMYLPQYRDLLLGALDHGYGHCNVLVLSPHAVPLLARGYSAMTPLAFEDIGLDQLQTLSGNAIDAVVLSVPQRMGKDLLPAHELQRFGEGVTIHQVQGTVWGLRLVQSWPAHPVDRARCLPRPPLHRFIEHPQYPPHRVWEQAATASPSVLQ
jgi:hypothetical protein